MLYGLYRAGGAVLDILLYPVVLVLTRLRLHDRYALRQRLGGISPPCRLPTGDAVPRIWIHAASVGEVAAAGVLIRELTAGGQEVDLVLTTMTLQGLQVARQNLSPAVCCFLAPLDLPRCVRRVVAQVRPDIYICLETELWPAVLGELRRAGTTLLLLNGRMSARSFRRYRLARGLMAELLRGFSGVAVITAEDGARFVGLGVAPARIRVTGNIKFDFPPEDMPALRRRYRKRIGVDREMVFLCGSTHSGEERLLAGVYRDLAVRSPQGLVWVIAPRHLRRLSEIRETLTGQGLGFDLYSDLGSKPRQHAIVVMDCMGELARLYCAADFNFVGGSLVPRGGHNIMEAARWGLPVYYGPHIDDFKDAAHILEEAGAGFRVADPRQLLDRIANHMQDQPLYQHACAAAAAAVARHRGAAGRQAAMVTRLLAGSGVHEQDR